jgi:hypothetical protein
MTNSVQRAGLFALYQLTVALGIVMMPLALVARRAGVRVPVGRLVEATGNAYDEARQ